MKFFVVCPRGLEVQLHAELSSIVNGLKKPQAGRDASVNSAIEAKELSNLASQFQSVMLPPVPIKATGGIEIAGPLALAMAINLHSRIASRVLAQLSMAPYRKEDDVYKAVRGLAWEDWFSPNQTLKVDLTSHKSPLTSLNFVTLRIKDAICDRLREVKGARPSIDTATPDVRVTAYLDATHVITYIDTSGEALFKRGWRDEKGAAPLKENLAAGILAISGWQPNQSLFDPMCGSGTFLIEAAQIAYHIPPGAIRAGILDEFDSAFMNDSVDQLESEAPPVEIPAKTIEAETSKNQEATPEIKRPVWQAPVLEGTGKPLVTNMSPVKPVVASSTSSEATTISQEASKQATTRKISVYKPTRVDLVTSLQGFGFLRLKPFEQKSELMLWETLCELAKEDIAKHRSRKIQIAGSDINERMVAICKRNWQKAKLPGLPIVRQVDALKAKSPFSNTNTTDEINGVMLFNPPYGERLEIKGGRGSKEGEEERSGRGPRDRLPKNISDPEFVEFLAQFGRHLKESFCGWQVNVLTADMGLPGQLRMKESKRTPLFNGAIECRLFRFDIRGL